MNHLLDCGCNMRLAAARDVTLRGECGADLPVGQAVSVQLLRQRDGAVPDSAQFEHNKVHQTSHALVLLSLQSI
jgi:hypothetical protein